jgi:glycosyltransferase involved in cell wall biosynthesis
MRIGLDGFPLASPKTGVGHYTHELARALARIAPEDHFELISPLKFSEGITAEVDSIPNLGLVNPRTNRITRRWWGIGLPRYVRRAGLDLFHGTNYEVPLWNRNRNVITVHDLSIFVHPEKHEPHIARRAQRRLPVMLRAAARIITDTEAIKHELAERFKINPRRIAVTPLAPRQSFHPATPEECAPVLRRLDIQDDFILFVGTIEPRKNLLTLVRAFEKMLRRSSLGAQLVIAGGPGWLRDEFDHSIARSKFGDRLRLTGYLADDELRALYSSCKVFVYPSLYEGFGLPPLEAMACGAPVIASRIPSLQETLADHALMVSPLDVDELANTLERLLSDEMEQKRLAEKGQKHAAGFCWKETARLTLNIYKELLQEKQ